MQRTETKQIFYFQMPCDFFDNDDRIKILEAQSNGYIYSNLYMKLLLKSAKTGGYYRISPQLPHDAKSLAAITNIDYDIVRNGLIILQSLELIDVLDDGTIVVPAAADFAERIKVLADNPHAERQRRYKERKRAEQAALESQKIGKIENVTETSPEVTPSDEKSDDSYSYNYSYSKKERKKEREKKSPADAADETHTQNKKQNKSSSVIPSFEEVKDFIHERGDLISAEKFFNYYKSQGWPLDDWKARVAYWEETEKERATQPAADVPPAPPGYTRDREGFLYMANDSDPDGLISDPSADLKTFLGGGG